MERIKIKRFRELPSIGHVVIIPIQTSSCKSYDGSSVPKAHVMTEHVLGEARLWCELRGTDYSSHLNVEHNEQNTSDINYSACGTFSLKYFSNLKYYRPVMFVLTPNTCFNYFWSHSAKVGTHKTAAVGIWRKTAKCINVNEINIK